MSQCSAFPKNSGLDLSQSPVSSLHLRQRILMLQLPHSTHHGSSTKWSYLPVSKGNSANTKKKQP